MTVPVLIVALTFAPLPLRPPARVAAPAVAAVESPAYGVTARLRPQGARLKGWLATARQRSPTVQRLVDRIEKSDVIVYLDISHRLAPDVAACLTWMASTGTGRMVRATFRHDLSANQAIAMVAHELQHVVEVADHPEVRSSETLRALYARIGRPSGKDGLRWDTADAVAVGTMARLEAAAPVRRDAGDATKGM